MRYTALDEPQLARRIEQDLAVIVDAVRAAFDPVAVVLGGSYGRGEGAGRLLHGEWRALNDYDVWVVAARPQPAGDIGVQLARKLHVDSVDIAVVTARMLERMPPSQLAYDLRHGGRVLWGRPDVLALLPDSGAELIPHADALRLLFNRAAGLIGHFALADFRTLAEAPPDETQAVQLAHAWSACGDAALILCGRYDHRAAVKADRACAELERAGVLGAAALDAVRTAYRMRLGTALPLPRGRAAEYATAAAALLRTLSWVLARTLPGAAEMDDVTERLDRYEAAHGGVLRAAATLRTVVPARLWARRAEVRAQAACARLLVESSDVHSPGTAGPVPPADWDRRRCEAYEAWHHACH